MAKRCKSQRLVRFADSLGSGFVEATCELQHGHIGTHYWNGIPWETKAGDGYKRRLVKAIERLEQELAAIAPLLADVKASPPEPELGRPPQTEEEAAELMRRYALFA